MAAAIRGPMSKQWSGNGVQRRRCGAPTSGRDTPQAAGACGAPVSARSIRPGCIRRLVVARKAHLRTILTSIAAPALISVYDELIRRSLPRASAFHRLIAAGGRQLGSTHAFLPGKRRLPLFSQRCGRSIYTPFLSAAGWKS